LKGLRKEAFEVFVTRRSQDLSGKPDEARLGSDRMISLGSVLYQNLELEGAAEQANKTDF
jgi:hypothetical protein